ncbi:carboxymuconolactone decarboxylase family protein [Aurantimonas sp. VKM B-3413]|uniref:carboxymuconolactone decarboxylase family protein n=1 Tax=Aurantimonas sp. VKM B-3413 TaxID=2779401 RepID=UPI001E5AF9E8|nr:carboxymuconolactone decarboxylase family protein [Aurantimonas sp. VKM B-3413]MCB8839889.1 carboxymuconolactone decarboxylase family protein [Aurantimonas sp. VKM B-3413]
MTKDYNEIADRVVSGADLLAQAAPDAMKGFSALGRATYHDGALPAKVKELMALAIGIADRCDGCVGYHARAAFRRGATREEVAETIAVAVQMGGGPSMVYGGEALRAYDTFANGKGSGKA